MKIVQLIYSLSAGGAETLVKELSHELNRQGHEVTVLLLDCFKNTTYERESFKYLADVGVSIMSLERIPGSIGVKAFCKLAKIMRLGKYDILHSHLAISDIMAWFLCSYFLKNIRHVSTIHNSVVYQKGLVSKIWRYCQKRTTTVFCSKAALEANDGMFGYARFIQNGASMRKYCSDNRVREKIRTELCLGAEVPLIINIGRIVKQKNQLVLLESILLLKKLVPGIKCIICGDGLDRQALERYVKDHELEDTVYFLGIRKDVASLLLSSDVFVSTSIHEGLPITVLEAFFAGLLCVLSPIKEHVDIAKNVVGVRVAADNTPEAVAKEISRFISLPIPDKLGLQQKRKEVLEPYSITTCARNYSQLYEEIS